ncbi:M23 family metallopeptidase [Dactylosporangium sucinum]|uniref:M23ase beta-sheet core domain-containing protein n=1 Tax=Dactylosporangium sucinum TaxID=1424081 RepID=A0A917TIR3_9ACTN|nr:M23 family metallopeptidase [Dactylosporangium sucinum]GGM24029.1 hypothetical protein GCM10007977_026470 [Dactylosporangium sucinum]
MSRALPIALAAAAVLILAPVVLVVLVAATVVGSSPAWACTAVPLTTSATGPTGDPAATGDTWPAEGSWSGEQVGHAATIVEVGAELHVPPAGWTIAVATAMQESSLRNLGHLGGRNDHDSLGLFQQRPSQGWGTPEQILDPRYAAGKFYEALLKVDGWQSMSLTQAAQQVQRSAYPDAYAKWQAEAEHLVELIKGRLGITCSAGGTGPWRLPLPEGSYEFGSPYGPRGGAMHRGVDLMASYGTPILAAAAGTVTSAECTSPFCDRPGDRDRNGYGITPGCGLAVEIQHADGIGTTYCHASSLSVHVGQQVNAGDEIGRVGSTGHSSGNHLHFQVHQPAPPINNSTTIDPVPFMAGVGVHL